MAEIKFMHKISKGGKYNQIYLPKEMERHFDVGDIVEVRLIGKKQGLFIHKVKLTGFKERLIKDIFKFLERFKDIEQIFITGSFLTKKVEYNDIDIFVLVKKEENGAFEDKIHKELTEEFNLKFHVISGLREKLIENLKFSPMMRSMFSRFVSNKEFKVPEERKIDKNHLLLSLMAPEDLIDIDIEEGKLYYDSLRKLFIVERFLNNEEEDILEVYKAIKKELGEKLFEEMRTNQFISKKDSKKIKEVILIKLKKIKRRLNGKR